MMIKQSRAAAVETTPETRHPQTHETPNGVQLKVLEKELSRAMDAVAYAQSKGYKLPNSSIAIMEAPTQLDEALKGGGRLAIGSAHLPTEGGWYLIVRIPNANLNHGNNDNNAVTFEPITTAQMSVLIEKEKRSKYDILSVNGDAVVAANTGRTIALNITNGLFLSVNDGSYEPARVVVLEETSSGVTVQPNAKAAVRL